MAARTWFNQFYRVVFRRINHIPRLVPSETRWSVYKLNSKISRYQIIDHISFLKKLDRLTLFNNYKLSRFFGFLSKFLNMDEDIGDQSFQPPNSVRGMKKLDRSSFKQVVKIPAIKVPIKEVAMLNKHLKKSLCKISKIKPIAHLSDDDPEKDKFRLFLLKPQKYINADSFDASERQLLERAGIELPSGLIWTDVELGYDNWNVPEILRAVLPGESDSVSGFSNIGHIAHLNLRDEVIDFKYLIGEVILDKVSTVKTVVNKLNVIDNTFRNFEMELLAGEKDFFATVRENKCIYQFDFDKVYWNSRLGGEHAYVTNKLKSGDFVFDVFAGVGPFAIPTAKKGCHVFANDLNPHSFKWLTHNKTLNKVTTKFETSNLDGREFIHSILKPFISTQWQELVSATNSDKENSHKNPKFNIIMNLPALAVEFLDTFLFLFNDIPDTLTKLNTCYLPHIYCYCFYKGDNPDEDIKVRVSKVLDTDNLKDFEIRFVRNVAPNKDMYCVQFVIPPTVLCQKIEEDTTKKESLQDVITESSPEAKRRRTEEDIL